MIPPDLKIANAATAQLYAQFGLQICGRIHQDHNLLGVAAALEQVLSGHQTLSRPMPDLQRLAAD
jgi:hypothetical protein